MGILFIDSSKKKKHMSMQEDTFVFRQLKKDSFSTTQMIAAGFLMAIVSGAGLLMLPFSSRSGEWTNFVDALFTATTSICVTGLTTVNTLEHWSAFGKIVIIVLMQFGGLGVITFTTSMLLLLGKRITLKERLLIQDAFNLDTLRGLVKLTIKVVKGTMLIEGIGALLYAFQFVPQFGFYSGIGKSIFTAVSAFCNAGMDLTGPASLVPYRGNILVNVVTMSLIIVGGIGFPVWWDVVRICKLKDKKRIGIRGLLRKFQLHTKLVLTITVFLIVSGAVLILFFERSNPNTLAKLPWWEKGMAAVFQSVTTRTAGFLTIPQENFTDTSNLLFIVLMFIGGSPSGTAGGVKTVTVGVLLLTALSVVKQKEDTEIFHRKVKPDSVRKALAVVTIFLRCLSHPP